METLQYLIEEAKVRTLWWALCIFAISYMLSHTSKSMWMNVPISILILCGLRILFNEVEFRLKVRKAHQQTYLSHLERKQLSINDSSVSNASVPPKWKRKIDSPMVEEAMKEFINKILQDFVTDLWYSDITPDKEAPALMHSVIMDVLSEISGRLKEVNLVDLLTRDVVELLGDHLDLFRRNQTAIGVDVMGTLSFEERDEMLKHHLMASEELHPALISSECEYKVLQRLMGGVLAIVLRTREAPLVRCIARELLTCLVMLPVMNFASPSSINELIEYIILTTKDEGDKEPHDEHSTNIGGCNRDHAVAAERPQNDKASLGKNIMFDDQGADKTLIIFKNQRDVPIDASEKHLFDAIHDVSMQTQQAEWARVLEAATQKRTEVLMPENLENMWTKGRNYKKKVQKNATAKPKRDLRKTIPNQKPEHSTGTEKEATVHKILNPNPDTNRNDIAVHLSLDLSKKSASSCKELDVTSIVTGGNTSSIKKSNSTSDLEVQEKMEIAFTGEGSGPIISEFYSADLDRHNEVPSVKSTLDMVLFSEGQHFPKLKCRVLGAYFEQLGSNSFAVYSIAVTDADKNTWFVKRRYRNFERLHRKLKDIPNYTLHLPPKRIFSSSTEDAFVLQRCIQFDKYLQDLLSIANVAEQHEVWDFLSVTSKNYAFGKSSSVIRTLAVNVDDAVDDIVRQFKGVSDGLKRKVVGPSSLYYEPVSLVSDRNVSWKVDEMYKLLSQNTTESGRSFSDNEEADKNSFHGNEDIGSSGQAKEGHSDTEFNLKGNPPRVIECDEEFRSSNLEKKHGSEVQSRSHILDGYPGENFHIASDHLKDSVGVPPEWTPPNLSVPVLNLVDKIFQLNRRGWLRRQVFWISKQILQLMMEDAIDDWLLRQIHWLRRDDIISHGIRWVQDVLWPDGTFFLKLNTQSEMDDCQSNPGSSSSKPESFEQQLESARRASDVKKWILNGAPTTLVSLIGHKQYNRCAEDMYYFLQSTICLKQLAYGLLELVLVSVFPELRDLVLDVHKSMHPENV